MNVNRLRAWWAEFNELHFVVRRAIWLTLFMALLFLALWIRDLTGEKDITNYVATIGAAGILWASGAWYGFVGGWMVLRSFVRIFL